MHGTHGAAKGENALIVAVTLPAQMPDVGDKLVHNIVVIALVIFDSPAVVGTYGGPGLVVDGVGAVDGALAGLNPGGPGGGHVVSLEVEETAALAGEKQNGLSVGAVDLELHIPAQIAAVVLKITYFHMVTSLSSY